MLFRRKDFERQMTFWDFYVIWKKTTRTTELSKLKFDGLKTTWNTDTFLKTWLLRTCLTNCFPEFQCRKGFSFEPLRRVQWKCVVLFSFLWLCSAQQDWRKSTFWHYLQLRTSLIDTLQRHLVEFKSFRVEKRKNLLKNGLIIFCNENRLFYFNCRNVKLPALFWTDRLCWFLSRQKHLQRLQARLIGKLTEEEDIGTWSTFKIAAKMTSQGQLKMVS